MRKFYAGIAALLLVLGISASARADLVTNGSFETGTLAGWTDGGNLGWNVVAAVAAPGEGVFGINNGAVGSFSTLSQTLTTTPGANYAIDFWIRNDGAGIFNVVFDGSTVYSESGIAHAYARHTVFGIAPTASTLLQLQSRDDPGFLQFDGIHVNARVPEPSTLTLLALGAAALAGSMRKRRRKADAA